MANIYSLLAAAYKKRVDERLNNSSRWAYRQQSAPFKAHLWVKFDQPLPETLCGKRGVSFVGGNYKPEEDEKCKVCKRMIKHKWQQRST